MKPRTQIMDESTIKRTMARITHEVLERNQGVGDLCVLGVRRRGIPLAEMLCANIRRFEGVDVPLGHLDITLRRDDMSDEEKEKYVAESFVPCDLQDKTVLIVDDVLFTGRTARAAMETVFAFGRPRAVQLAVLVDRGHRELPIRPDYVGKNVPTSRNETVAVRLHGVDGENAVYICDL
jgi:pyrimidine operon attenuation protein/uracil phosphoribosyltransferase